ncbi:hypothetical protein [uncultured Methanobrevibacter sp.]|uniref:hypothetical protein n=1 Tax=uncultured Methanobrevibacter sp. TaxID=253161 RepID=UPI0025D0B107|nr:hypothetical protein [uncultured Methanobrevibacter sp.]
MIFEVSLSLTLSPTYIVISGSTLISVFTDDTITVTEAFEALYLSYPKNSIVKRAFPAFNAVKD